MAPVSPFAHFKKYQPTILKLYQICWVGGHLLSFLTIAVVVVSVNMIF